MDEHNISEFFFQTLCLRTSLEMPSSVRACPQLCFVFSTCCRTQTSACQASHNPCRRRSHVQMTRSLRTQICSAFGNVAELGPGKLRDSRGVRNFENMESSGDVVLLRADYYKYIAGYIGICTDRSGQPYCGPLHSVLLIPLNDRQSVGATAECLIILLYNHFLLFDDYHFVSLSIIIIISLLLFMMNSIQT